MTPLERFQTRFVVPLIERLPQFKRCPGGFFRCVHGGCGRLLGHQDIAEGMCLGHKMVRATSISKVEFFNILMGWVK